MQDKHVDKAGWRVPRWCREADVGKSTTHALIKSGKLRSVRLGRARIILTSPREYLERLAAQQSGDAA